MFSYMYKKKSRLAQKWIKIDPESNKDLGVAKN
jgi:hypothetical protein